MANNFKKFFCTLLNYKNRSTRLFSTIKMPVVKLGKLNILQIKKYSQFLHNGFKVSKLFDLFDNYDSLLCGYFI